MKAPQKAGKGIGQSRVSVRGGAAKVRHLDAIEAERSQAMLELCTGDSSAQVVQADVSAGGFLSRDRLPQPLAQPEIFNRMTTAYHFPHHGRKTYDGLEVQRLAVNVSCGQS